MCTDSYINYLNQALEALFRPVEENGFWNTKEKRIIRALNCKIGVNDSLNWYEDARLFHRYPPFALMGVAEWRISELGDTCYDQKIRANLAWYRDIILDAKKRRLIPSYGIGPLLYTYVNLSNLWPDKEVTETLTADSIDRFQFIQSEDALILMGLAANWDMLRLSQREFVRKAVEKFLSFQREDGLFQLPTDPESYLHQNQQYIIWGLGEYAQREYGEKIGNSLKRNVEYTLKYRWRKDSGILWWTKEDNLYRYSKGKIAKCLIKYDISRDLLFECHQTFFFNSIHYLNLLKIKNYDEYAKRALQFIYGKNAFGINLLYLSDLGVPWRVITVNRKWKIKKHMFKGTYEIGSYIRALTFALSE